MNQQPIFSEREKEVIELLLQGKSNKQIALSLDISQNTVEYHLKNIYKKLGVNSRVEAVLRLGKSVGHDMSRPLGESVVEKNNEFAENDGKSLSLRRQEMNKKYKLGLFIIILGIVVFSSIVLFNSKNQLTEQAISLSLSPTEVIEFINPKGKILYVTTQNDFYIADADGFNAELVLSDSDAPYDLSPGPHIVNAALSPDAKQIAYVSDGYIYLKDIQTGQQNRLNDERMGGEYTSMQWSPDGERIGFDCYPRSISEICALDIETGHIDILTDSKMLGAIGMDGAYFGGWSQDGSKIGFCLKIAPQVSGRPATSLYWLDENTREVKMVFDEQEIQDALIGCTTLLPNGEKILFNVLLPDKSQHLYSVEIDGGNLKEILLSETKDQDAYLAPPIVFSPDNTSYYVNYCAMQLYMGVCTPAILSFDSKLLYQLNLKDVAIKSWVSGSP
jgi:DNA-binding CsgD family transcriptional regulator